MTDPDTAPPARQPLFNLPTVVTALIAALLGIHFVREFLLPTETDLQVILAFAFIPARITAADEVASILPGGEAAEIWTFVTYSLLHADWGHVAINCLWLAAFGTPLAWRFGAVRFLLFSAVCAVGGAMLHLALHSDDMTPLVGASAAISGQMAAAIRFVLFGGTLIGGLPGDRAGEAYRRPASPFSVIIRDSRVLAFLAVWFGINFLFGAFGAGEGLASGAIAWEAHIGGFLVGLLLFPLFDPVGEARSPGRT